MKNSSSPNSPKGSRGPKKGKSPRNGKDDPFFRPPHPLGFQFLSEERPLRASKFRSVLPSIMAKYGLGRKLGVERFNAAWREALTAVFTPVDSYDAYAMGTEPQGKLELFLKYARPVSYRGGVLRIQIASNLLNQELQFHIGELLSEIRERLPEENVQSIRVVAR